MYCMFSIMFCLVIILRLHSRSCLFTSILEIFIFRPFGGPSVPFFEYLQWMIDHGLLFSTMFGIGQLLEKVGKDYIFL